MNVYEYKLENGKVEEIIFENVRMLGYMETGIVDYDYRYVCEDYQLDNNKIYTKIHVVKEETKHMYFSNKQDVDKLFLIERL